MGEGDQPSDPTNEDQELFERALKHAWTLMQVKHIRAGDFAAWAAAYASRRELGLALEAESAATGVPVPPAKMAELMRATILPHFQKAGVAFSLTTPPRRDDYDDYDDEAEMEGDGQDSPTQANSTQSARRPRSSLPVERHSIAAQEPTMEASAAQSNASAAQPTSSTPPAIATLALSHPVTGTSSPANQPVVTATANNGNGNGGVGDDSWQTTSASNTTSLSSARSVRSESLEKGDSGNDGVSDNDNISNNDGVPTNNGIPTNDGVPSNDNVPRNDSAPSNDDGSDDEDEWIVDDFGKRCRIYPHITVRLPPVQVQQEEEAREQGSTGKSSGERSTAEEAVKVKAVGEKGKKK